MKYNCARRCCILNTTHNETRENCYKHFYLTELMISKENRKNTYLTISNTHGQITNRNYRSPRLFLNRTTSKKKTKPKLYKPLNFQSIDGHIDSPDGKTTSVVVKH